MNESLKRAVLEQLGMDPDDLTEEDHGTLQDICNHGIDGGFTGFIYYADTCEFYDDNKQDIIALCREFADEFGQGISELIASFNCLDLTVAEVDAFLICGDDENEEQIKNALAWFAAEEVARLYEN